LLALLELFFRTAIPTSERPQGYFETETTLWKLDRDAQAQGLATMGRFAEQRGRWRVNNEGWNSPIDYTPGGDATRRIAVIGDSYVEALQVDIDESYPYLHMARHVMRRFAPDVLVLNLVHNDFLESFADLPDGEGGVQWLRVRREQGRLEEVPPAPDYSASEYSPAKRWLKASASVRYLYYNLAIEKLWRVSDAADGAAAEVSYNGNVAVGAVHRQAGLIGEVVEYVFAALRVEYPELRVIVILDAPRPGIYTVSDSATDLGFIGDIVGAAARDHGFDFLNLDGPMRSEFAATHVRFESDFDGHWDRRGHRFVADRLLGLLEQGGRY
jgi:hypothetical protein